jgi:MFS family permease
MEAVSTTSASQANMALSNRCSAKFGAARCSVSLAGCLHFNPGCVSGRLADRFGSRRLAVIGMFLLGAGLALVPTCPRSRDGLCGARLAVGRGVC